MEFVALRLITTEVRTSQDHRWAHKTSNNDTLSCHKLLAFLFSFFLAFFFFFLRQMFCNPEYPQLQAPSCLSGKTRGTH